MLGGCQKAITDEAAGARRTSRHFGDSRNCALCGTVSDCVTLGQQAWNSGLPVCTGASGK